MELTIHSNRQEIIQSMDHLPSDGVLYCIFNENGLGMDI